MNTESSPAKASSKLQVITQKALELDRKLDVAKKQTHLAKARFKSAKKAYKESKAVLREVKHAAKKLHKHLQEKLDSAKNGQSNKTEKKAVKAKTREGAKKDLSRR